MTIIRLVFEGRMRFEVPYFDQLLVANGGCLPRELEFHALWHYFVMAALAYEQCKEGMQYEGELAVKFQPKAIYKSVMRMHGIAHESITRSMWDVIQRQRRAEGFSSNTDLPEWCRFYGKVEGN